MAGVFLVSEFGVFWSRVLIGVFLVFEFGLFFCVVIMFAFFWCLSLAFFLELCFCWRSLCASVCLFFFFGGGGLLSLALFFLVFEFDILLECGMLCNDCNAVFRA